MHMSAVFMLNKYFQPVCLLSQAMGEIIKSADHSLSNYPNRLAYVYKDAFKHKFKNKNKNKNKILSNCTELQKYIIHVH